ncbi:MAG: glycosyltransferase family 39 protein [Opitutae bacterium]|nr:glycosyltransferase family 39 protein [Opitutae bacterium]
MDQAAPISRRPDWPLWLLLIGLAAYSVLLWRHTLVQPGGSDTSGYFNTARLFAQGKLSAPMRPVDGLPPAELPKYAYAPLGFQPDLAQARLTPSYPIGLSLFFFAFAKLFGAGLGPNLVLIMHTLAGVALLYALTRSMGGSGWAALLGTIMLALSPLYLQFAVQAMSDLPATVWVLAAVWLAWRNPAAHWSVLGAGFAVGVAVLVRPTNLLGILPVLLALGRPGRRWLWLALGGLPCAVLLAWFNRAAYGSALTSGYGDVSTLFSLRWVQGTLLHYAKWLPVVATPVAVLALGLPWLARPARRAALVLGVWLTTYLGFYAFYFHTHEYWWALRFVMPALPPLIIAAVLVAERLLSSWAAPRRRHAAWVTLFLLAWTGNRYWDRKWDVVSGGAWENTYPKTMRWMQAHVPPEAVVLTMQTSGSFFYYTDFRLLRWDMLEDRWSQIHDTLRDRKFPVYGVFFDFEEKRAIEQQTPGRWVKVTQIQQVGIWRLDLEATSP